MTASRTLTAKDNATYLIRREDLLALSVRRQLVALRKSLTDLIGRTPEALWTDTDRTRLLTILYESEVLVREAYGKLSGTVREELMQLGTQQSRRATEQMARLAKMDTVELAMPTQYQIASILSTNPIQGQVMREWWAEQSRRLQRNFRIQMQLGMMRQETLAELIARVRGKRMPDGSYAGGIMNTTYRAAEALVRTAVNQVANEAALESYKGNPEVSDRYEYRAVLDNRTTRICWDTDGTEYAYDDPQRVMPPLHWNCRSTILPVINYKELGLTPPPKRIKPKWEDRPVPPKKKTRRRRKSTARKAPRAATTMVQGRDFAKTKIPALHQKVFTRGVRDDNDREDNMLKLILNQQGFDGKPMVVSKAEFDRLIAGGAEGWWRGMGSTAERGAKQAAAFMDGELFAGVGLYGNGTYVAAFGKLERTAAYEASQYGSKLLRGAFRPGAKIGDFFELRKGMNQWKHEIEQRIDKLLLLVPDKYVNTVYEMLDGDPRERGAANRLLAKATPADQAIVNGLRDAFGQQFIASDVGRYAAYKGYDAYWASSRQNYMVILNRTAVFVDGTIYQ